MTSVYVFRSRSLKVTARKGTRQSIRNSFMNEKQQTHPIRWLGMISWIGSVRLAWSCVLAELFKTVNKFMNEMLQYGK